LILSRHRGISGNPGRQRSLNPYAQINVDISVTAKAVFRYITRTDFLPAYKKIKVEKETVLLIDKLRSRVLRAKRETRFTKSHQKPSLEESVRNMFWYTYNYQYEADRSEDVDVTDAIQKLKRKYGTSEVRLDQEFVADVIGTIDEFEHDCSRVRYFRHQELANKKRG
jgi:hypothetical protein